MFDFLSLLNSFHPPTHTLRGYAVEDVQYNFGILLLQLRSWNMTTLLKWSLNGWETRAVSWSDWIVDVTIWCCTTNGHIHYPSSKYTLKKTKKHYYINYLCKFMNNSWLPGFDLWTWLRTWLSRIDTWDLLVPTSDLMVLTLRLVSGLGRD